MTMKRLFVLAALAAALAAGAGTLGVTTALAKDKSTTLADILKTTYLNKPVSLWLRGWDPTAGHPITGGGTLTAIGSDYITVKSSDGLHTYPMTAILQIY
jgi:hypothetical protein